MPRVAKYFFFRNHVKDFDPKNPRHVILGTIMEPNWELHCFKTKKEIMDQVDLLSEDLNKPELSKEDDLAEIIKAIRNNRYISETE